MTVVGLLSALDGIWTLSGVAFTPQPPVLIASESQPAKEAKAKQLLEQGIEFASRNKDRESLGVLHEALRLFQELGNDQQGGRVFYWLGYAYDDLSRYTEALENYNQSLAIKRELGDRRGEGQTLNNIGVVYENLSRYEEALDNYHQSLTIKRELGDRRGEGKTLNNIGVVYRQLSRYEEALDNYHQSLTIKRELGDRKGEGKTLNNIGVVYENLSRYEEALESYHQSLAIKRELGDRRGEGQTLNNIGVVYRQLSRYEEALDNYNQSLAIKRELGDRRGEGQTLNNIGIVYRQLSRYEEALDNYNQDLTITRELGDRRGEGQTLNNIGVVYENLSRYEEALENYNQSLAITRELGNRHGEARTLQNLGATFSALKQPQLAVVFYKDAVNTYESIRSNIEGLSKDLQQSFTTSIEGTYRHLADLLLKQDRILEAQQVLDLLKVQELDDYLRGVRGPHARLDFAKPELTVLAKYNELQQSAIKIGKELAELRETPFIQRSDLQKDRIRTLVNLQKDILSGFNQFIISTEVKALQFAQTHDEQKQALSLEDLNALRDELKTLEAILLYPLILDDRLELVITTPNSPPLRRTVAVTKDELTQAISDYRQVLQDPTADPLPQAQKLYQWLIAPLEDDLTQAQAKTIIYSPDSSLRYLPLAALHDGNQWLVENYRINNITAKSLTNFTQQPTQFPTLLAGAFTSGSHDFQIGNQTIGFTGLPFAGEEVNSLSKLLPNGLKLIDNDFSLDTTTEAMNEFNILHLATHAQFLPGTPRDSFIVFGNGQKATLDEISNWTLNNIDLVVLSACETGLGGKFGNGEEVLGLGYQFQTGGARAAIASLWKVSDGGTQVLMNVFYDVLKDGDVTKTEALRQAQIALIHSQSGTTGNQRARVVIQQQKQLPSTVTNHLSHPYYWAPFILIGNGL